MVINLIARHKNSDAESLTIESDNANVWVSMRLKSDSNSTALEQVAVCVDKDDLLKAVKIL